MKNKSLILTILTVAAFTLGCDKPKTASEQLDVVQKKTAEVSQDMRDYTFAQKAEFTSKMQGQLADINKELDQLSARIEKSSDAVKAEATPKLQALREKADLLGKQLGEAEIATESTWDSVKAATKNAYDELNHGFNQARQWVSDKIAP